MIICSICKSENDQYAHICRKCGGFLQNRVHNLDLFATLWEVIEKPGSAFRLITLAAHKNYSLLLYVFYGINLMFTGICYFKLGDRFENMIMLFFWVLNIGIPLGVVLGPIVSLFHSLLIKIFSGKSSFRTSLGITSYAFMPIAISLWLVLPIALLTFGMYLFTFNPSPMAIKPISYILLVGLNILLIVWAFILSIIGTKVGNQVPFWKSLLIIIILYVSLLSAFFKSGEYVQKHIQVKYISTIR